MKTNPPNGGFLFASLKNLDYNEYIHFNRELYYEVTVVLYDHW